MRQKWEYIGKYKELNTESDYPRMADSLESGPYKNEDKIIRFLKSGTKMAAVAGYPKDVYSKETIPGEQIIMHDEKYAWNSVLAYYVEKYHLRFPAEIEKYILTNT